MSELRIKNRSEASDFFLGFVCNCLSYFTTAKITFTSILYLQFTHMIYKHNKNSKTMTKRVQANKAMGFTVPDTIPVLQQTSQLKSLDGLENDFATAEQTHLNQSLYHPGDSSLQKDCCW